MRLLGGFVAKRWLFKQQQLARKPVFIFWAMTMARYPPTHTCREGGCDERERGCMQKRRTKITHCRWEKHHINCCVMSTLCSNWYSGGMADRAFPLARAYVAQHGELSQWIYERNLCFRLSFLNVFLLILIRIWSADGVGIESETKRKHNYIKCYNPSREEGLWLNWLHHAR